MRLVFALAVMLCALGVARADPCAAPPFDAAAAENARSVTGSAWTFTEGREGAPEGPGWEAYAALIAFTIETECVASSAGFAAKLAAWQGRHGLKPSGIMDQGTAERLTQAWHAKRRHVRRAQTSACDIAEEGALTEIARGDVWGKPEKARAGAYAAYRKMIEAAKKEAPYIFAGRIDLKIVSAWRSQERDIERCKTGKCSRVSMAPSCSAHWGGRALDLNVGYIEGHSPADMDYANRLFMSQQPAYRWLLRNAHRFGFANYFAEPWHWEWNGE